MDAGRHVLIIINKRAGVIMIIDEEEGQAIAEEDVMENIKVMYDVFIQNNLDTTSHSIEWLEMTHE